MPQLYMITKTGEAESITSHYLFALGMYRALYIVNWAYRYFMEDFYDWIAIVAGCVQTALYCDFFYLYITKGGWRACARAVVTGGVVLLYAGTLLIIVPSDSTVMKGKELKLPA